MHKEIINVGINCQHDKWHNRNTPKFSNLVYEDIIHVKTELNCTAYGDAWQGIVVCVGQELPYPQNNSATQSSEQMEPKLSM